MGLSPSGWGIDQILAVRVLQTSAAMLFPVTNFNYYFETFADGSHGSQFTLPCGFFAFVFQAHVYLESYISLFSVGIL